jgi:hypothetical protein
VGAAATPFLHRGANIQTRSTCIDHGDERWEGKTLDEMRKKKMMRRRKKLMNELGFLPSPNVLYLYLWAFIFCSEQTIKEHQCIKRKRYIQKKRERGKKMGQYLSRSTAYLVLDSGAYVIRKEEKSY